MMLPWPLALLISGVLLYTTAVAAIAAAVGRATMRDQLQRERARRRRAQARLARAHARARDPQILPGLFEQADRALDADADTVLQHALTPQAIAAYDELRRRQP